LSGGEIVVYAGANVTGLTVSSGGTELILSSGETFAPAAQLNGASSIAVDATVDRLIHAMASLEIGSAGQGAWYESVSGGAVHLQSAMLAPEHLSLTHR